VGDCYQRDGPRRHRFVPRRRSFQRLELAPGGAVENVPPARAQLVADRVSRLEFAIAAELDAFSQQLFSL
jgi:hypothetical protein